jgi:hypothetical protein
MRRHLFVAAALTLSFVAKTAAADSADDGADFAAPVESPAIYDSATTRESDDFATTPAKIQDPPPAIATPATAMTPAPVVAQSPQIATVSEVAPEHAPHVAAASKLSDDPATADDPHQGALGAFRLGALAGVGAPSIFSGEGLAKIGDWVGLTGDYGAAPSISLPVGNGGATISQTTVSAGARVFPFRGAFFIGGSVGQQSVTAKVTQSVQGQSGVANFSTSAIFIEPQIGILYRTSFGLAIGCDAGLEIPVSARGQSSVTDGIPLPSVLSQAMTYAEKGPIPSVNLLRLGYVL